MAQVITGKVLKILDEKTGVSKRTGNTWVAQEFVIETDGQYPKKVCMQIFGEQKIAEANLQIGDTIKAHYEIDAREYNARWYNTVNAWKVEKLTQQTQTSQTVTPPAQQTVSQPVAERTRGATTNSYDDDDLPF